MNASQPTEAPPGAAGAVLRDAIRYWERRRVGYNLVLASVALGWLLFTWPHFRSAFTRQSAVSLAALVAFANACYCAACPVDFIFQRLSRTESLATHRRILWWIGTLGAVGLAWCWIADEIYPAVR